MKILDINTGSFRLLKPGSLRPLGRSRLFPRFHVLFLLYQSLEIVVKAKPFLIDLLPDHLKELVAVRWQPLGAVCLGAARVGALDDTVGGIDNVAEVSVLVLSDLVFVRVLHQRLDALSA